MQGGYKMLAISVNLQIAI